MFIKERLCLSGEKVDSLRLIEVRDLQVNIVNDQQGPGWGLFQ